MKISSQSHITVVVPALPTKREKFSGEELSKYLSAIFPGIRIQIAADTDAVSGDRILVGGPERNQMTASCISEETFDALVPGPEGMLIKAFGEDTLVCAGSSKNVNERERGTLYAVYELLERYLGCSFAAYKNPTIAGGEYVPQLAEADISGIEYIKAAADNTFRGGNVEYHGRVVDRILNRSFVDWLGKNRYNRVYNWMYAFEQEKEAGLIEELDRRGICVMVGYHDMLPFFLPPKGNKDFPEHYYETHPEYYKLMEDGTRFEIVDKWGGWALCSRNPELPEVFGNNILKWVEQNPAVDMISISPLDGKHPSCTCPECSKYTNAENYAYFLNEVAKVVGKKNPNIKIKLSLYVDLWKYPEGLELEPNVLVMESVWPATGLRTIGKKDGSCVNGTFFETDLLEWGKGAKELAYYEYYMGVHSARQRYIPAVDEMQSIWTRYTQNGVSGSSTQIEYFNFWNHIFNFYCFARTGYDVSWSMDDHLERFTKIFGEGASYVAEVIHMAEAVLEGQVKISQAGLYVMDNIDKEACYDLYEKAFAAASTPEARNCIRLMRMEFRYSDLECRHTKLHSQQGMRYTPYEVCDDPTGELYYMSRNFDSSRWCNPGLGIMFPIEGEKQAEFVPDHWYAFEK